ncbi:MAG: OmpA family protein [Saprospiraceae bacterium]|nr:OmpA family protein [Saprospiraceae bacterium]
MRFLSFVVFLLFIVYALFARWYFVCEIRNLCEEAPVEIPRQKTLKLTEGDSTVLLTGYDQFVFDSAQISPQLNDNNRQFLDTVAYILSENPAKNLGITAFFRGSEAGQNAGFFENIGNARADSIRTLLIDRGLEEDRVTIDYGRSEDEALQEPLLFNMYLPSAPAEFDKLAFTFNNMTFSDANFEVDSDVFTPGESFLLYADSVQTYFELNEEKGMTIIGHTDNTGTEKYNMNLGLRRAQSAMRYFREMGIVNEIKIESEGEKRPVATNDTKSGRQKNRRVNFVLE